MHKIFRTKCPRDSSLTAFLLTNSHVYLYPSSSSSHSPQLSLSKKKMAEPIFLMSRNLLLLKHNDCYKTFWYLPEFMWQLWGRRLVSFFFYFHSWFLIHHCAEECSYYLCSWTWESWGESGDRIFSWLPS